MLNACLSGGVLVLDDEEVVACMVVSALERDGIRCTAVESVEAAVVRLLQEPSIRVVIVDYSAIAPAPQPSIEKLRCCQPSLIIVGNSGEDRSPEFAALGVQRFLLKPWHVSELRALL